MTPQEWPDDSRAHAESKERASTPEEHLWCIALAVGHGEWETCDGTPVDINRHVTELQRALEDGKRQPMLRAQAVAVAEERTRERDQLRAAMPAGLAFELLVAQIRRFRRTPCPTMGFNPADGPEGTLRALRDELTELEAEEHGSCAWRSEALDVLVCAVHLLIAADMRVDVSVAEQAAKLGARLDHIDRGGTWADAKRMETGVCEECSGFGFRPVWAPIDGVVEDEACPHCRGSGQRI